MELENARTVSPVDQVLGIANLPFKISPVMMIELAYRAAKAASYQEAEDFFYRTNKIRVNDDTIRQVVNYIGNIVYEEDCRKASAAENFDESELPRNDTKGSVLYIMADGAALNTRTRDTNGSTWKENKLAVAFTDGDMYYWKSKEGKEKHRIDRREYISLIGSSYEFKYHMLALARRNGYGKIKQTVIISDGATWIRNIKEEVFPDAQQILDLFHLKENTYNFAKTIFSNDEKKYVPWAENICQKLENGEWKAVLKKLEKYKEIKLPAGIVNLHTYITNNKNNIDYPYYKQQGWFVGSGAIESGNKIVLQNRLKLAGMRWNVSTAQCMLSLKAKIESGLWDSQTVPFLMKQMCGG